MNYIYLFTFFGRNLVHKKVGELIKGVDKKGKDEEGRGKDRKTN